MTIMGSECQNLRNHLVAYLYDEVPEPRSSRIREHLALCPACTEELDSLYRTREIVEWYRLSTPMEPLPDEFPETVMERIRADRPQRQKAPSHRATWWMAAAAAVFLVGIIVTANLPHSEEGGVSMDASLAPIHVRPIGGRGNSATATVESPGAESASAPIGSATPADTLVPSQP